MIENVEQTLKSLPVEAYSSVLDRLLEGCQVIGSDWRYRYVNEAFLKYGNVAGEKMLGRTVVEAHPGIENSGLLAAMRDCLERRVPKRVEGELVFPGGAKGIFEFYIQPVPEGILVLSLNITERKKANQKVLEQGFILDAIAQLSRGAESDIDIDIILESFAQQLRRLVSFDRFSVSWLDENEVKLLAVSTKLPTELDKGAIFSLEDSATGWVAEHRSPLIIADMTRDSVLSTSKIKLKEGLRSSVHVPLLGRSEVLGSLNLSSVQPNAYGERERTILEYLADHLAGSIINAFRHRQERAYRFELDRRGMEQIDFSKAIAHELKTPLTSIIAAAELLSEEIEEGLDEPQHRLLKNIVRSAHSLETSLDELLETTKVGTLTLEIMPLNMKGLLERIAEELTPVARRKEQSLEAVLPAALPMINADVQRLEQVLRNLLVNALKFTPKGGSITLKANKGDGELLVEIEDSGIGIPESEQSKLFEPYYRVEADRRQFPGLGLGLALCKQIVELHGGRIWVESQPGKGSVFAFSLPL